MLFRVVLIVVVFVSSSWGQETADSDVGNLFEQAFDEQPSPQTPSPQTQFESNLADAKVFAAHTKLMSEIRSVNATFSAAALQAKKFFVENDRPDLELVASAHGLTIQLSNLYLELEKVWAQYLTQCDPKNPNCKRAVTLRDDALRMSNIWRRG